MRNSQFRFRTSIVALVVGAAAVAAVIQTNSAVTAQQRPAPPTTPRIYIFDNGGIAGLDPQLFGFKREEIKEPDFVDVSYLIVHPRGTLMFDSGGIPDAEFKADGSPAVDGVMRATRPLKPQMAAIGYTPSDIGYFALSHYHSDHTANANDFAGATWIVQKAERDAMFAATPAPIMKQEHYSALKTAKTRVLDDEELDVFGDGAVVLKPTPGHTPGHQVLFVRLARRGPVLLTGDMYHFPEEVATGRMPAAEWNVAAARESRAKVQALLKETGAEMWIAHDKATAARLPKAPQFVE